MVPLARNDDVDIGFDVEFLACLCEKKHLESV